MSYPKKPTYSVFVVVKFGDSKLIDQGYEWCQQFKYAILNMTVTCPSDPTYYVKYIITNTTPLRKLLFDSVEILQTYKAYPMDYELVKEFKNRIADPTTDENAPYTGWFVSKEELETFCKAKASSIE